MSHKITQKDVNNIVWKACDTFRGIIDPSQYKDYILTMLFLKYVTDVYNEKKAEYKEKYAGNQDRVQRALERERFVVPEVSSFDYLYDNRNSPKIGEMINHALAELEEANREKLGGHDGSNIFRNIDFNSSNLGDAKDKSTRLRNLLNDFKSLDLSQSHLENNDVIGGAYEFLIANFASDSGKKAGEFFTPAEVSTLLAKLTKSAPGSRIYDPTCGSGSLLIKAGREVGNNNFSLFGQEANGSTWALSVMNMYLHGYDNAIIRWGDTLRNPKHKEGDKLMLFDTVVANPPFSLDKWGAEELENDSYNRFWRGMPPKSKGDWAFISHMIESLNAHGKAGVVVPHGVLFRGGAEARIREKLLKDNHIDYNGSITNAVKMAQDYNKKNKKKLKIEVETRNLLEVEEAIKSGADRIMLDNMDVQTMKKAVKLINGKCETEASGGITRDMLKEVASTGVDYISAGALTHSAANIDLSLKAVK